MTTRADRVEGVVFFAENHRGMRANGRRLLCENGRGFTGMRQGMAEHLEELARRYYAGDIAVVDEFLQLYCFGQEERKAAKVRTDTDPAAPTGD